MSLQKNEVLLARLDERIASLSKRVDELEDDCITKKEFGPVQKAVYAAIGLILCGSVGTLVHYILKML